MNEFNLLRKLERVKAPPDFEEKVLAQLSLRRKRNLRVKYLRFSLAGAISAALIFFIIINIFILPRKSSVELADLKKGFSSAIEKGEILGKETIPIIETVDFAGEMQTHSPQPRSIYILEQVIEAKSTGMRY